MDNHSIHSAAHSAARSDRWGGQHLVDARDEARLDRAQNEDDAIIEEILTDSNGLGWISVACLIFNRMIGSGVFNSSAVVYSNTKSVGIASLLWLFGAAVAISGVIVYIELGLTLPRYRIDDRKTKVSIIRSGGELVYLNYFLKVPKYLATSVFGVSFMVFGTTAVNSIAFALGVLQAASAEQTAGKVAGIAIAVNTFSCLLHSMSRKWGILLNNFLGLVKLAMLVVMIILGFIWLGKDNSIAAANFDSRTAFDTTKSPTGVYRYAEAAVFVIFPFGGFHQANYVLGEIKRPRRNFPIVSVLGVLLITCLVVTLNILYAAVIPKKILFEPGHDLAFEFFSRTVGAATSGESQTRAISGSLRALSAIGNVIVFTFTAARVKQEVAREGVLPFSLFFAASYSFSFRHGFRRLPPSPSSYQLHTSRAPAAALGLHWAVTCILIIGAVFGTTSDPTQFTAPSYYLVLATYAYGLSVIWFAFIGVSLLVLRLWPGSGWHDKSPVPHGLGVVAAAVFAVTNSFALIAIWIPDPKETFLAQSRQVPWFAGQTFAFSVLAAGALYWVGFRSYMYLRKSKAGKKLEITRHPVLVMRPSRKSASWFSFLSSPTDGEGRGADEEGKGEMVLLYEIIKVRWPQYQEKEKEADGSTTSTELSETGNRDSQMLVNRGGREQDSMVMSGGRAHASTGANG